MTTTDISLRRLCRVRPFPRVKLRVSWRDRVGSDPKNGMKCGHRIEATIEPEHVLVEVGLQMLGLDTAMMCSLDPSFQVAENEMDHGQVRLGLVRVASERQRLMAVSRVGKPRIAGPSIGAHSCARRNIVFDKAGKRVGAPIWHNTKPQPPRIDAASVLLAVILARPNLNRADHDGLVMNAASLSARLSADKTFINLYRVLAANGVTFWPNHPGAELVEYLKGRLITTKRKLALELNGRLARHLRSHEVCAPKPCRKRRMARLHYSARGERRISFAATTTQHYGRAGCEAVRLADNTALRTRKPIRPTNGFKVASASRIVREHPLKLGKGSWEAANVHVRDNGRFLPLCQATG
jgi:hypothetical protein